MDKTKVFVDTETGEILRSEIISNSGAGILETLIFVDSKTGEEFSSEIVGRDIPGVTFVDKEDFWTHELVIDGRVCDRIQRTNKRQWVFYLHIQDGKLKEAEGRIREGITKALFEGYPYEVMFKSLDVQLADGLEFLHHQM